jgi:lipopolysaccharide export system protein LptA
MIGARGRLTAPILAASFALACAVPLAAQTVSNTFGGLSESSEEPIDIESDLLVVHDKEKYATFSGSVKAVQGTTTLRAKELLVHYTGGDKLAPGGKKDAAPTGAKVADAQAPGDAAPGAAADGAKAKDGDTQITKIEAKGDVIITSDDDQTTTSDWALYDLPAQLVTVGGNVVLTQGKNVLKGDRLVIDLKTGESRFENTGNTAAGGGRIRALFLPKQNGGGDGKSGEDKSGDAKSGEAKPGAAKPGETAKHEAAKDPKPDSDASEKADEDDGWNSNADPFIPEMRP